MQSKSEKSKRKEINMINETLRVNYGTGRALLRHKTLSFIVLERVLN